MDPTVYVRFFPPTQFQVPYTDGAQHCHVSSRLLHSPTINLLCYLFVKEIIILQKQTANLQLPKLFKEPIKFTEKFDKLKNTIETLSKNEKKVKIKKKYIS